jgi:hypothetical protein
VGRTDGMLARRKLKLVLKKYEKESVRVNGRICASREGFVCKLEMTRVNLLTLKH